MNSKYVCDLQYAKRLAELGVKQESEFYWNNVKGKDEFRLIRNRDTMKSEFWEYYSAFTVGELLEKLPKSIKQGELNYYFEMGYCNCGEVVLDYYAKERRSDNLIDIRGSLYLCHDYLASNCLAKMLIYLLENKLIKVEEINK